jgi:hypothetical protein
MDRSQDLIDSGDGLIVFGRFQILVLDMLFDDSTAQFSASLHSIFTHALRNTLAIASNIQKSSPSHLIALAAVVKKKRQAPVTPMRFLPYFI